MRASDTRRLGAIIAKRRLHIRGAPQRTVVVSLGKPRKTKGSEDWECPFRVKGAGIHRFEYGYGIDAFQALTMALEGIRYVLDRSPKPLVWGGVIDNHTGFQRVIPLVPERGGTLRMERVVDRELRHWLEQLKRRHSEGHRIEAARRSAKRVV